MSELKTVIKELKETRKMANMELEGTDPKTRPGREMLRNQAVGKLKALTDGYKEALVKSVFTIFTTGPGTKRFAELAKEMDALVVDGEEFYRNLALRCQQTMGTKQTFGITQFVLLTRELRGFAIDSKIDFTNPDFTNDTQASTLAEIIDVVREIVEKSNGQRLIKTYIETQVVNQALEQEADTKVVPVVITNIAEYAQDSLIGTLFRGKGLTVETKEEVTQETVNKTFEQIKKLLKG